MTFIGKLDERYEGKLRKDNVMMARKVQKIGELSTRQQPTNAPKWTVKQNTGQLDSTYLVNICSLTYVAKNFKPRHKLNHSQWNSNGEPYSAKLSLHYSYSLFVFVVGCYGHCKGLHCILTTIPLSC